jgi:putative hydrolase of the HAD superfamily
MEKKIIRALVFDYGGVISKQQYSENVNNILQILNQDSNDFINVYQSNRDKYDSGQLSGKEYWHSILQHYGLELNDSKITNLIKEDVKSWTKINDSMLQYIKNNRENICKLAIISNMTQDTLEFIKKHFQWLELFDELLFSCEFGKNKPDTMIYNACISRIAIPAQECLFVDDSIKNVERALKTGMKVIHFKSFTQFLLELEQKYCLCQ